jgi:hypothetical protein
MVGVFLRKQNTIEEISSASVIRDLPFERKRQWSKASRERQTSKKNFRWEEAEKGPGSKSVV